MDTPTSFPSWVYHKTEPAVIVHSKEAFEALPNPAEWLETPHVPPPAVPVAPLVTALEPSSAVLGTPSFTLHVHGGGFSPDAVIVWNGGDEPTTVVSATELTTGVNMDTAEVAMRLPVSVRNGDGTMSNELPFELLAAPTRAARRQKES